MGLEDHEHPTIDELGFVVALVTGSVHVFAQP